MTKTHEMRTAPAARVAQSKTNADRHGAQYNKFTLYFDGTESVPVECFELKHDVANVGRTVDGVAVEFSWDDE